MIVDNGGIKSFRIMKYNKYNLWRLNKDHKNVVVFYYILN